MAETPKFENVDQLLDAVEGVDHSDKTNPESNKDKELSDKERREIKKMFEERELEDKLTLADITRGELRDLHNVMDESRPDED